MTKPSVASKLVEINHPDACPPQWLPVLLASSSRREDNPAPRFDDEDLLFEGKNEALSMERRMDEAIGCADPDTVWACTLICHQVHRLVEPGHSNCKAKCPTHCPLPPPLASPSPPPPPSPDPPNGEEACEGRGYGKASCELVGCCAYAECSIGDGSGECFNAVGPAQCALVEFSSQVETCP